MDIIRKLHEGEQPPYRLLLLADPEMEVIDHYLPRSSCYVLEGDGKIKGVYVLLPTRPHTIELVNIAADESEQGKGYGKKMIAHALQTARAEGYKFIDIGTDSSGTKQIELYQKCGFRIIGVDPDFFIKHYSQPIIDNGVQCRDMIRMQQPL